MGPLQGIRILELVGLGPAPFAGMMLADMGAEVIAVDRLEAGDAPTLKVDINRRGKRSIILDLKAEKDRDIFLKLCETSDALIEGFRPGVMEKLGLGPDVCLERNPKLIYGRMTGWGQDGPLSKAAGHDINYIALSGALYSMGDKDTPPSVPLNLVGDYGGGGMMLAFGLVSALLESKSSGKGQVVDVSMVEGSSLLMSVFHSLKASGLWVEARGVNLLDGAAHFYGTYETSDGEYISLGALEISFMRILVDKAGLDADFLKDHANPAKWKGLRQKLETLFKSRSQQQWCDLLEGSDACFAPVLPFWQAADHPHNIARNSFIEVDGLSQPAPSPRFSRTAPEVIHGPIEAGQDTEEILKELGLFLKK